ncbi:MAG: hypothetical protein IJ856_01350, partial [Candidatus Methanomethylophilaceae archaeon]|nr:hypothetical protein [Candidatus Methanomethylophilaceae archaeon]
MPTVKLTAEGSKPVISRTIWIPEKASFEDLAKVTDRIFGFTLGLRHEFDIGGFFTIGYLGHADKDEVRESPAFYEGDEVTYTYGGSWRISFSWQKSRKGMPEDHFILTTAKGQFLDDAFHDFADMAGFVKVDGTRFSEEQIAMVNRSLTDTDVHGVGGEPVA